jgi:polysaccharide export outer membrane protein
MRNVYRTLIIALLLMASGSGCATAPQKAISPPKEVGPGEMLKRLTTLMQTPSEPRQVGPPPTEIPASSSIGDGGPAGYYKYLLTLMETPAEKRQADRPRALIPPPLAAEEPSRETSGPSVEPPPAVPSTPAATEVAPSPSPEKKAKYRIGFEDIVRVSVWENPELTMDVTVRPDGNISLPLINEIHAADLTPIELSDVIARNLKKFMKDPQVTVIVTQTNSQKIYLVGNVLRPGAYPLRHEMTVLQALSLAGGFTAFASPREMKIISGLGTKQDSRKINYYKMIEDIELEKYLLKSGDTIVIP